MNNCKICGSDQLKSLSNGASQIIFCEECLQIVQGFARCGSCGGSQLHYRPTTAQGGDEQFICKCGEVNLFRSAAKAFQPVQRGAAQTTMSALDQMISSIPVSTGAKQNSSIAGMAVGNGSSLVENAKRRAEASNGGQCKANTHEGIDLAESKNNRGSLVEAARKRAIFAADRQGQSLAEITRV